LITIQCNAGNTSTNLIEEIPGRGTVWYRRTGSANILFLSKLAAPKQISLLYTRMMAASKSLSNQMTGYNIWMST